MHRRKIAGSAAGSITSSTTPAIPIITNYYNLPLYNADYIPSTIFNDQEQQRDAIEIRLTSGGESKFRYTRWLFL